MDDKDTASRFDVFVSYNTSDRVAVERIARGLTEYDSSEAALIKGEQSAAIEEKLGYQGRKEIIHRDDLVLLEQNGSNT